MTPLWTGCAVENFELLSSGMALVEIVVVVAHFSYFLEVIKSLIFHYKETSWKFKKLGFHWKSLKLENFRTNQKMSLVCQRKPLKVQRFIKGCRYHLKNSLNYKKTLKIVKETS